MRSPTSLRAIAIAAIALAPIAGVACDSQKAPAAEAGAAATVAPVTRSLDG